MRTASGVGALVLTASIVLAACSGQGSESRQAEGATASSVASATAVDSPAPSQSPTAEPSVSAEPEPSGSVEPEPSGTAETIVKALPVDAVTVCVFNDLRSSQGNIKVDFGSERRTRSVPPAGQFCETDEGLATWLPGYGAYPMVKAYITMPFGAYRILQTSNEPLFYPYLYIKDHDRWMGSFGFREDEETWIQTSDKVVIRAHRLPDSRGSKNFEYHLMFCDDAAPAFTCYA